MKDPRSSAFTEPEIFNFVRGNAFSNFHLDLFMMDFLILEEFRFLSMSHYFITIFLFGQDIAELPDLAIPLDH